ncbi:palmitoyltransferase [Hypoxylon texense]
MQLHYIGVIQNDRRPGVDLCTADAVKDHYGFFERTVVGEFMYMYAKTLAERTKPGQRIDIEEYERKCTFHAYARSEGICGVIATDLEYPKLAAHRLLNRVLDEFLTAYPKPTSWSTGKLTMPQLQEYLTQYQDPHKADVLLRIQDELNETKITMHKNIENVLERGEKIDDLVAKSEGLSTQSKMFYQQAKKQNSCCILM